MSFTKEELDLILDLCKKKLKGIDWVLKEKASELKENKKSDLEDKKNRLDSLIQKIEDM